MSCEGRSPSCVYSIKRWSQTIRFQVANTAQNECKSDIHLSRRHQYLIVTPNPLMKIQFAPITSNWIETAPLSINFLQRRRPRHERGLLGQGAGSIRIAQMHFSKLITQWGEEKHQMWWLETACMCEHGDVNPWQTRAPSADTKTLADDIFPQR